MEYRFLTQEERDDMIAEAMLHREREHFQYALNIANFQAMLNSLPPEADTWKVGNGSESYRAYLERLLAEHQTEMAKVEKVYEALDQQLPAGMRREAAAQRVLAKQAPQRLG